MRNRETGSWKARSLTGLKSALIVEGILVFTDPALRDLFLRSLIPVVVADRNSRLLPHLLDGGKQHADQIFWTAGINMPNKIAFLR